MLCKLSDNSYFGEIALLTDESRSATVTVISDTAKIHAIHKKQFEELMRAMPNVLQESRLLLHKDVLDRIPIFQGLTALNKKRITDAMQSINFNAGTYICTQGSPGNTFYIISEGFCKVTIKNDGEEEKTVATLEPSDFFGFNIL